MLRPLQVLLDLIDVEDADAQLIFAGDYVNRGPESRGVIDLLLKLPNARFVRGNHDDVFDLILNGQSQTLYPPAVDAVAAFKWFVEQGMDNTLQSYGVDYAMIDNAARRPGKSAIDQLFAPVPPEHRRFFRNLELIVEFDDCFVIHANWHVDESSEDPAISSRLATSQALRQRAIWNRFTDNQIQREKAWKRRGFFGHTPLVHYHSSGRNGNVPLRGPNIVLLDTGAALGPAGRLSAYCPETDQFLQVDHFGNPVT
jgi:hypothetical protein